MTTAREIIDRWPTRVMLACDVDVPAGTVRQWHARNSIPGAFDLRLVNAAGRRGINLSLEELAVARSAAA